jgi:hypothetical protein
MADKKLPPKGENMVGRYMGESQGHEDMTGSHAPVKPMPTPVNRGGKSDKLPIGPKY